MSNKVVFILLALLAFVTPAVFAVSGTLGVAVSITANTQTQVDFLTQETLIITSDTTGTVTVTSAPTASVTLPFGYVALAVGIGYTITFNPSSAQVTATFTTAPNSVTTTLLSNVGASIPGVLYFDSTANAYCDIGVPATITNGQVTFQMPQLGQYLVLGITATVPRPAVYGRVIVTQNDNSARSYSYNDNKFTMQLQCSGTGASRLQIQKSTTSATPAPAGRAAFGAFYNITLTGTSSFSATMTQAYTNSELTAAGIVSAQSLRFAVKSNNEWTFPSSGNSVNATASTFSQSTTSFSEWGTYGSTTSGAASAFAGTMLMLAVAVMSAFGVICV